MAEVKLAPKEFEEARDFAGADWENLNPDSRRKLLRGYQLPTVFASFRWRQLPPTVQKNLAMSLIGEKSGR